MDALTCKFWWKPNDLEGKFLTLLELNNLCKPKCKDGLGFEKSKDINNALLAKFAWMIAFKRDSLCMLILRAKYKVKQDQLHKTPPKNASPVWKAIENAKKIIAKSACYLIRDGALINIWTSPWVPWLNNFTLTPSLKPYIDKPMMVFMLINNITHIWKESLIHELFEP